MPTLVIDNVSQTFGSGESAVQALKPTSLSVEAGELAALIGPSGSGKSTLLLAISLIQPPMTGRVVIADECLYDGGPTGADVRAFRRRRIGFIFQQHNLIPFLNARDNVALMPRLNGVPTLSRPARRGAAGLPRDRPPGGGATRQAFRRRAAARRDRPRAANDPVLLLADEPTAALDTGRGMNVMALLRRIARERRSALIAVTHDHRMIEGFDTTYQLEDGRIAQVQRSAEAGAN